MKLGDAVFTCRAKDERSHGWLSYSAPKGKRFVFLLLGTVELDAYDFDVDGALNRLGWHFRDSDGNPKGGDGTAPSHSDDSAAIAQPVPARLTDGEGD